MAKAQGAYSGAFMGERSVSCTVVSPTPIEFLPGDYCIYIINGASERFELDFIPEVKKISSAESRGDAFSYDLKFVSLKYELERCIMLDVVPEDNNSHYTGLATWSVFGGIDTLVERIQANLDRLYSDDKKWVVSVAQGIDSEEQDLSFSNTNVWDALSMSKSIFDLNFFVSNRNFVIGADSESISHTFEYGKGKGLYEIQRTSSNSQAVVTRLRAYGANRNLPKNYNKEGNVPEAQYIPSLMLPGYSQTLIDYIDSDNKSIYIHRLKVLQQMIYVQQG